MPYRLRQFDPRPGKTRWDVCEGEFEDHEREVAIGVAEALLAQDGRAIEVLNGDGHVVWSSSEE